MNWGPKVWIYEVRKVVSGLRLFISHFPRADVTLWLCLCHCCWITHEQDDQLCCTESSWKGITLWTKEHTQRKLVKFIFLLRSPKGLKVSLHLQNFPTCHLRILLLELFNQLNKLVTFPHTNKLRQYTLFQHLPDSFPFVRSICPTCTCPDINLVPTQ
jgi:hypothetical protein